MLSKRPFERSEREGPKNIYQKVQGLTYYQRFTSNATTSTTGLQGLCYSPYEGLDIILQRRYAEGLVAIRLKRDLKIQEIWSLV